VNIVDIQEIVMVQLLTRDTLEAIVVQVMKTDDNDNVRTTTVVRGRPAWLAGGPSIGI